MNDICFSVYWLPGGVDNLRIILSEFLYSFISEPLPVRMKSYIITSDNSS